MLTAERIPAFLDKWIQSHIAAGTNLTTGFKPIMFEEFGKKLEPAQQTSFMIEQLRDPVYTSTYASVESAINANQPIAGSMFWKMSIPVFDRQDPRGESPLQHSQLCLSCTHLLQGVLLLVNVKGSARRLLCAHLPSSWLFMFPPCAVLTWCCPACCCCVSVLQVRMVCLSLTPPCV